MYIKEKKKWCALVDALSTVDWQPDEAALTIMGIFIANPLDGHGCQ